MSGEIDKIIAEKGILPKSCEYHTWRSMKPSGKLRVLVLKSDMIARCEYTCPKCDKQGYNEEPWKRPFKTKCKHCGASIAVPKLKAQFKREQKAAQAAGE